MIKFWKKRKQLKGIHYVSKVKVEKRQATYHTDRDLSASHEESFQVPLKRAWIVEFNGNVFLYQA